MGTFSFNTLPELLDIRPWLWHDYPNYKIKYQVLPRFTAFLNLDNQLDETNLENNLLSKMSSSRRQEFRKSINLKERTIVKNKILNLLNAYKSMMEFKNEYRNSTFLSCLEKLLKNNLNNAFYFECISAEGSFLSGSYWLIEDNTALYFWGASAKNCSSCAGTRVIIDGIKYLYKNGIKRFDFEGINSPNLGWFKLSFGAEIESYYRISLKNN